jgi:hypothetical protein
MSTQPTIQDQIVLLDPDLPPDTLTGDKAGPPHTLIHKLWPGTPSQVAAQSAPSEWSVTGAVLAIQFDQIQESEVTQAQQPPQKLPILLLDILAQDNNLQSFILLSESIVWANHQPEELLHAIDLALNLELGSLAINLSQQGGDLFPRHERIQQAAHVLAPPVISIEPGPYLGGLDESKDWLEEHAHEYHGQWVAIRDGRLLKAADSLDELKPVIGDREEIARTLITKVL